VLCFGKSQHGFNVSLTLILEICCVALLWFETDMLQNSELNDSQKLLLYRDYDLMGANISVMNKYSEVY